MTTVTLSDPMDPQAFALLQASHALMQALFPPEDNFALDPNALTGPDIRFFTARDGDRVLGTAALALRDGYGEVKSLFVDQDARGKGVGEALLRRLETEARRLGLACLRLETGRPLQAAHRLYLQNGFHSRGSFGAYTDSPASIFMEKPL